MKKRILALLLSAALLLTTGIGTTVFAAEGEGSPPGESCTHAHDEACGYSAAVDGTDCTFAHVHDVDCGWADAVAGADCSVEAAHTVHDENCGGDVDTGEGCAFAHAHDETCGYVEAKGASLCAVEAAHTHGGDCGYSAAVAEQPCRHMHDADCGGLSIGQSGGPATPTNAVAFTIPENEYGEALFYLPEGVPVTEADLLAGVSAADETGADVPVTVQDAGGLDLSNPVPGGEGFPPQPYTITYAAAHPTSGQGFTATRDCYVTVGVMLLALTGDFAGLKTAAENGGNYQLTGDISTNETYFKIINDKYYGAGLFVERDLTLDMNGHNLTIDVSGGSASAIKIESGVTLTIMDSNPGANKLTVTISRSPFNNEGAGIHVTEGALIIQSGTVEASAFGSGAGIGGGRSGDGGNITINGGTVTATTTGNGAGIGGGSSGNGGNITISGTAKVTATSIRGAGIGGGADGDGGTIIISGNADVTAQTSRYASAGIGGGRGGASGDIIIGGSAKVTATGGIGEGGGAGIGSGGAPSNGSPGAVGTIAITTTGTVTATGGAGEGGGTYGTGGTGAAIGAGGSAGQSDGTPGIDGKIALHASNGVGGSITPLGTSLADKGGSKTFTITPDSGFAIKEVLVDGVNVPAAVSSGSHTLTNVTAYHTIEAVFIANPALTLSASPASPFTPPGDATLTATLSGAFSGDNSGKTITFTVNGTSHTATTNASGVATCTLTNPSAGTYSFGASFAGDMQNNAATATDITGYIVNIYPILSANPTSLPFGALPVDATGTKTVTISGSDLTGNIAYGMTGDTSAFTVTETSWDAASGGTLQVTFKPTSITAYSATLTFSSPGAANVTVSLTGRGATTYALGVSAGAGGSVDASVNGDYPEGTTVSIRATPNAGYSFAGWTSSAGGSFGSRTSASTTFTMPANAVTLTASFTRNSGGNPDPGPDPTTYYTLTVRNGSGSGRYAAGERVSITADTPPSGKVFDRWTGGSDAAFGNRYSTATTFTMPAGNVTLEAAYRDAGNPGDAGISPQRETFDRNTANARHRDVTVSLSSGWHSLTAIRYGTTTLTAGVEYTVSGNQYTFKKAWLSTLGTGTHHFIFDMSGGADPIFTLSVVDSTSGSDDSGGDGGSDDQDRDSFTLQTLTDPATGITVTGSFTVGAVLIVSENILHTEESGCAACAEIRARRQAGDVLALYNITVSGGYRGEITVTFPVDSAYNGQNAAILHCADRKLEQKAVTITDGKAVGSFTSLSPFALLKPQAAPQDNHNPETGGYPDDASVSVPQTGDPGVHPLWWLWVLIPAAVLAVSLSVIIWRRRRAEG